ncbi:glycosyltransferase [Aquimarina aquimarini]|uniref:glycosyltransferase n=1 Tax=Aquimarina aquimarini TaxID=1191734 RepID=UPI000D550332|nr:glycosyltransferase [Aquimarina aquimarini]
MQETTNLPIIQSLWIGDQLSTVEQLCIASFINNNHEFHLYTYNDIKNVPNGTIIKDANEIIAEKEIFKHKKGSYAIFADWFRWELLYKRGNFWVDTDVVCLKPFIFDSDIIFGLEDMNIAGNAVMRIPENHFLGLEMKNICKSPNTFLPYDSLKKKRKKFLRQIFNNSRKNTGWGEAGGPYGFTQALKHFDLFDLAKPFTYFFPIHFSNWNSIYDNTLNDDIDLYSNTYAVHLWNEMSRNTSGFDKNAQFPENSIFEQLKRKHL